MAVMSNSKWQVKLVDDGMDIQRLVLLYAVEPCRNQSKTLERSLLIYQFHIDLTREIL